MAKPRAQDIFGYTPPPRVDGMGGHQSAAALNEEWLTPPAVLQALGPFDLDPCAPIKRPWDIAKQHYTIKDNGLSKPWEGRVFCNPPYGPETWKWMGRLAEHGNGVALIFARVETAVWFDHVWPRATGILFLKGRLTFFTVHGKLSSYNGGAPSALVAYGAGNAAVLQTCGLAGAYIDQARVRGD